jgi:RNA polymerase sigma-70 factor (ECF subfamily)
MPEYLDTELIDDFNHAKRKAFDELFARYFPLIYAFCCKLTDNTEESKDIAMEVMNKLFQKHTDFENLQNIRAFVYITARNTCLNYLRDLQIAAEAKKKLANTLPVTDDINARLDVEYIAEIKKSIDKLPARQRETIEYLYFSDTKYDYIDIAEKMNISVKTVSALRQNAIAMLRELMHSPSDLEAITFSVVVLSIFLTSAAGLG